MRASTNICLSVLLTGLSACRMDNPAFGQDEGTGADTAASEDGASSSSDASGSGEATSTETATSEATSDGTDPTTSDSASTGDGDSADATASDSASTGDGDTTDTADTTDTTDTTDSTDSTDSTDTSGGDGDSGPVTDTSTGGDGDGDAAVYFFGTEATYTGALGEATQVRPTVDAICQQTLESSGLSLPCENVHALISISGEDPLYKMPSNYGVPADVKIVGPNEDVITGGWDALILEDLQLSLADAGVLPPGVHWWSGATAEGGVSSNCGGWVPLPVENNGIAGASSSTAATGWMSAVSSACGTENHLVCLCW